MNGKEKQNFLRHIPAVSAIIENKRVKELIEKYSHNLVVESASDVTGLLREKILSTGEKELDKINLSLEKVIAMLEENIQAKVSPNLCKVINATGIVLHTNLGRALLAETAVSAVANIAGSYNNLELDLSTGERGSRYVHVEGLLSKITGAEGAMVVNNNAAAVLLVLNTFAKDKEVIVSRGQLVEIGGSFRVPDVMTASGARLVEVGTTNKTHLRDFENAINEETAMILKVHTSNYKVVGFTAEVGNEEMVKLGTERGIPVVEDLGSGVLINLKNYCLQEEPTVQDAIKAGVDVVTFSGDKLFGGPQAGIIVGRREYIEKMKKNPLTRAFRVDKLTFAALEATLKLYIDPEQAVKDIPTLQMLTVSIDQLEKKARRLVRSLKQKLADKAQINLDKGYSQVGGGAMPTEDIPSILVTIQPIKNSVTHLEEKLRLGEIPVLARIQKDQLLIDVRTVKDEEIALLVKAIEQAL